MNNYIALAIFIIIGGLFLGLGFMLVWNNKTRILKPKVKGQEWEYYTTGELLKQKFNSKFKKG